MSRTHRDFSDESDVSLVSSDGIRFNISSQDLARTSGFFKTMISLPQANEVSTIKSDFSESETRAKPIELITVDEDALTLEILLKLVMGLAPPLDRLTSYNDVRDVLSVAEKYEMPGAACLLQHVLRGHVTVMQDPFRQYAIAAKHSWKDIMDAALQRSMAVPLSLDDIPDIDGKDLAALILKRQRRLKRFNDALRSTGDDAVVRDANTGISSICGHAFAPDTLLIWAKFQLAAIARFGEVLSVEHLLRDNELDRLMTELEFRSCTTKCAAARPWQRLRLRLYEVLQESASTTV